jgi:hypothetical protein
LSTDVLRRDYLIGLLIPMKPNQGVIPIVLVMGVKVEVEAFFVT